jgi:hypothetical protein
MSRRDVRDQEKEEFLDQNPELIKFVTHFEVVEVSEDFGEDNDFLVIQPAIVEMPGYGIPIYGVEPPSFYEARVTHDGDVAPSFTAGMPVGPDLTLAEGVSSPFGSLFGGVLLGDDSGELAALSLSENGFGVFSGDLDGPGPVPFGVMPGYGMLSERPTEDFALDGDEVLVFGPYLPFDGPVQNEVNLRDGRFEAGNTEFGIDYTVLSGRGTVEINLFSLSDDPDDGPSAGGSSAFMRNGQDGSLEVEMADGTYDYAEISVTGNLQIGVVGIDVTSNTDFFIVGA